jgi:hypothetical protein
LRWTRQPIASWAARWLGYCSRDDVRQRLPEPRIGVPGRVPAARSGPAARLTAGGFILLSMASFQRDPEVAADRGERLEGPVAGLYLMNFMTQQASTGVDARRLKADALAAKRGDATALRRLRSGLRLSTRAGRPPMDGGPAARRLRGARPRRIRSARVVRRARAPGRGRPEPSPDAPRSGRRLRSSLASVPPASRSLPGRWSY